MTKKARLVNIHIIFCTILCLITSLLVFVNSQQNCEELKFEGELISICKNPKINGGVAIKCQGPQPPGTLVSYKCKPHFVLHRTLETRVGNMSGNVKTRTLKEGSLKCNEDGTWTGLPLFSNARCREVCGTRARTNPEPLIVNGVATNETTWPWHATLFRRRGQHMEYICGGSIIQRSAILTAAHCAMNTFDGTKENSVVVVVGAATSDFSKIKEQSSHAQIFKVKNNLVSENFDERKDFQADIAVLELDGVIEYSDYVSPVCLPDFLLDFNAVKEGRIGDVIGFGIDENEKISKILKHGRLEITSHTQCFIKLQRTISQSQFCAGTVKGNNWVSACNGDSGGGLFIPSVIDEKYYIHGIVSNGELKPRRRIFKCQNYAVFTRVHSFNPWLKHVLEKISSDKEGILGDDDGIEVIQNGTETHRMGFQPIPLEFKNEVTSLQLSYLDIDPESLLNSLEHMKTVRDLNLTNVRFTKPFPNRRVIRLPNLKTVTLDILSAVKFGNLNFINHLKFFEKDVKDLSDSAGDISRISGSQVNVYITIGIFKLIQVNHGSGKISLSQINFSNQILTNILAQKFNLNRLALSSCPFNMSILTEEKNGMGVAELKSLVLDKVMLEGDFNSNSLYNLLKNTRKLEELVISDTRRANLGEFSLTLNLVTLPSTVRHLSLTRTPLDLTSHAGSPQGIRFSELQVKSSQRNRPASTSIFFQETQDYTLFVPSNGQNRNGRMTSTPSSVPFPNLETFYCDLCLPSLDSIKDLNSFFPNLKQLVVKFQGNNFRVENLKSLVSNFGFLQSATFVPSIDGAVGIKLVRKQEQWVNVQPKLNHWDWEKIQLNYDLSRRSKFWTSEADYVCSARLSTLQRSAFETGQYIFDGRWSGGGRFSPILEKIQPRLESIEISNVDMSTKDLVASLRNCPNLKSLRLLSVSSLDLLSGETVDLPELIEYRSERGFVSIWENLAYEDLVVLMETYLPFQFVISEENESPDFDVSTTLLKSRVPKLHVQFGQCIVVSWDSTAGSLTSFSSYVNDWLRNGPRTSATYLNTLALQHTQLDPSAVPSSVSFLNLNFVILNDPSALLKKISGLKIFKFVNVRTSGFNDRTSSSNAYAREWPNLDLTHLAKHPLQIIAIEKAHLQNYVPGVQFPHVQILCLVSCSFETNFVKDFGSIFPNLKKLVILRGIVPSADTAGIILDGLKNHTNLEWILMNSQSLTFKKNSDRGSGEELRSILQSAGVGAGANLNNGQGQYFIVNRRRKSRSSSGAPGHGPWTWQNRITQEYIKTKLLLKIKGTADFGSDQKCHAYDLYTD